MFNCVMANLIAAINNISRKVGKWEKSQGRSILLCNLTANHCFAFLQVQLTVNSAKNKIRGKQVRKRNLQQWKPFVLPNSVIGDLNKAQPFIHAFCFDS